MKTKMAKKPLFLLIFKKMYGYHKSKETFSPLLIQANLSPTWKSPPIKKKNSLPPKRSPLPHSQEG